MPLSQAAQSQNASTTSGHYKDLKQKTFLVTGASSGIGRAIAIALGEQGAKVILTGRNEERLAETASHIAAATPLTADLTVETERNTLVGQLPILDGVCHSAGIIDPFPIRYLDENRFDKLFDINVKAPILLTSHLLRKKKLNQHASLLFISSISANRSFQGGALYSASKSAIEAFCSNITQENAEKAIRANSLKLGLVITPIHDHAKELAAAIGAIDYQTYESQYPLGFGKPEDVAAAALFFLSSASRWATSAHLVLDGGFSIKI